MVDSDPEDVVLVAAGIAGAVSLIIQGTGWWLPAQAPHVFNRSGHTGATASDQHGVAVREAAPAIEPPPPPGIPDTGAVWEGGSGAAHSSAASGQGTAAPLLRWGVTRAFWGLVSFALMGGMIVTFIYALVAERMHYDDLTGVIIGCTGCASFMIFALRKAGPVKRLGFWRETLRPFLISATMFAIGGTITGIARYWDYRTDDYRGLDDESKVALIFGLVFASLLFVALGLFTGRKPRQPRPFLQPEGDDRSPHDVAHAPDQSSEAGDT